MRGRGALLVLGLPRGGVPVGLEVALALDCPLDVFIVRKLGVPHHEELAFGAVASGGVLVLNEEIVKRCNLSEDTIARIEKRAYEEIRRREALYRGGGPAADPKGKTVILVDDGLATGASMRAAVKGLRLLSPYWITVAVPVGAPEICDRLRDEVDELVCALCPDPFHAVGLWYEDFTQTSDREVQEALEAARGAGVSTLQS